MKEQRRVCQFDWHEECTALEMMYLDAMVGRMAAVFVPQ